MRAVLAAFVLSILFISPLAAQELTGTLKQISDSGEFRIGFRVSEPPLSFIDEEGKPAGYSIDICNQIAAAVKHKIGKSIKVTYLPVNAENRFTALTDRPLHLYR